MIKYSDELQEIMNNLMTYPNVHTVYRSKKITNGQVTDIDCLVVHVSKKINAEDLEPNAIVPSIIGENIATDIIESPHPRSSVSCYEAGTQECLQDPKNFYTPLIGGLSFGISGVSCTLGAIVKDATDNTIVALTNNHCAGRLYDPAFGVMIASRTNTYGLLSYQPSITDAGSSQPRTFGSVKRAIPFKSNSISNLNVNIVDAAIVSIDMSIPPDIGMLNIAENTYLDFVASEDIDSYIGSVVYKVGRTTCVTSGIVLDTRGAVNNFLPSRPPIDPIAHGTNPQLEYINSIDQIVIQSLPNNIAIYDIIYQNNTYLAMGDLMVFSSGVAYESWDTSYYVFNDTYDDGIMNNVLYNISDRKGTSNKFFDYRNNKFIQIRSKLNPNSPYTNEYSDNIFTSIFKSNDGINWDMIYYTSNKYYGFLYANNIYMAIGSNCYMTSTDGETWTEVTNSSIPNYDPVPSFINSSNLAYGNNKFVGIYSGNNAGSLLFPGIGYVLTSENNGSTWNVSSPWPASTFRPGYIIYANNMFVILADRPSDKIQISQDGSTWTQISVPAGYWYSVAYGNGKFVAVQSNILDNPLVPSISEQVIVSSDGILWSPVQAIQSIYNWICIKYINNTFVASSLEGAIMTSLDGLTWDLILTPEDNTKSYLIAGDSGSITLTSDNKILGLNHAISGNKVPCGYLYPGLAYACRIDNVANLLQIKPWQGDVVVANSNKPTITVNGRTYVRYRNTNDPITHVEDS